MGEKTFYNNKKIMPFDALITAIESARGHGWNMHEYLGIIQTFLGDRLVTAELARVSDSIALLEASLTQLRNLTFDVCHRLEKR